MAMEGVAAKKLSAAPSWLISSSHLPNTREVV
jgi:hypothetical protein